MSRKLILAMAVSLLLVAGCGRPDRSSGDLRFGLSGEPNSLDPNVTFGSITHTVMMNIFDTLVFATADGTIVPGLAKSWEISPDRTEYTFCLRQDVRFHDGSPFNAEAVKFTFDRAVDPEMKSRNARSLLGPYSHSEVIDSHTVRLVFTEPYEPLLLRLTRTWLGIVSPAAVDRHGQAFGEHPVGTGPFMFEQRVGKSHITLVRNPDYRWGPSLFKHTGPAQVDKLTFHVVPESVTRVVALERGELDIIEDVPEFDAVRLQQSSDFSIQQSTQGGIPLIIYINCALTPTDDIRVRRALNHAIDQQAIVTTILGGMHTPAWGPLSPATWAYNPGVENMYPHDPTRAAALLEEAGFSAIEVGLIVSTGVGLRGDRRVAEMVQAQLAAVRIRCNILEMDLAAAEAAGAAGETHLYMNWGINEDPDVLRTRFAATAVSSRRSFTHYPDPELDGLLVSAYGLPLRDSARQQAYEAAQFIIMDKAVIIPLFNVNRIIGMSRSVHGISFDCTGTYTWLHEATIR